jgi:hypothetical protein
MGENGRMINRKTKALIPANQTHRLFLFDTLFARSLSLLNLIDGPRGIHIAAARQIAVATVSINTREGPSAAVGGIMNNVLILTKKGRPPKRLRPHGKKIS